MDYKIAQIGLLVKENTDTMIKGFDQFSMFMNEFSQSHSKQPYYSELNATKSQSIKGYRPLHPDLLIQKIYQTV